MSNNNSNNTKITTIIFDVDDTLYDVGTGFTAHRNGYGAQSFMVEKLQFESLEAAKVVRDEYFERYHSTAKALAVAQEEGKLPAGAPQFEAKDFGRMVGDQTGFYQAWRSQYKIATRFEGSECQHCGIFEWSSEYVKRVLIELGVWDDFGEDRLFAVDDVLPYCKPEKEAFDMIFERVGVTADECVMVEDSMKNIRKAKELGMKTLLVKGRPSDQTSASELTKPGDAPLESDPAVDAVIEDISQMRDVLPGLWGESPVEFKKVDNK